MPLHRITFLFLGLIATAPSATWEVRATAQDNCGHASLFLGEDGAPQRPAPPPGPLNSWNIQLEHSSSRNLPKAH